MEAVDIARKCGMYLDQYSDGQLLFPGNGEIIGDAAEKDQESDFESDDIDFEANIQTEEVIITNEDISRIALTKKKPTSNRSILPEYIPFDESSTPGRRYSKNSRKDSSRSPFVEYEGCYNYKKKYCSLPFARKL